MREGEEPGTPTPSPSSPSGLLGSLEERSRKAIAERELQVDLQRARLASWIALVAWPAFAAFDYLQAEVVGVGHLRELLAIRAAGELVLVALALWAHFDPHPTRFKVELGVLFSGATMTAGIALMCLYAGGFESIYAAGILLSSFNMIVAPRPFSTGVWWMGIVLLPYTLILFGSTLFLPEMNAALHSPRAMGYTAAFHFVGVAAAAVVALVGHVLWTMRRELYESQSVGRYRLTRLLGRGGMGEVWAAHHHGLRRDVAVKILQKQTDTDDSAGRRFEREIHAMAGLTHPNTVRLFDFGVGEDGRLYYAMELLEGETLRGLVKREGALPVERATYLVLQAAQALAEAHGRGIVHRDVKPDNLFITRIGDQSDFVKVLDFGIASVLDDPQLAVTRTGVVAGTPGTMSPEVILGNVASPASDVYALGTVFYFVLTGQMPFAGESSATLVAHVNEKVVPPSERRGAPITADVEAIVLRCLEKKPGDRYANAGELARALARCSTAGHWRPSLTPAPTSAPRADAHDDAEEHEATRTMGRRGEARKDPD